MTKYAIISFLIIFFKNIYYLEMTLYQGIRKFSLFTIHDT